MTDPITTPGDYVALSTLANAMLPSPVQLPSGKLTIQPSGIGTAKAWAFYR